MGRKTTTGILGVVAFGMTMAVGPAAHAVGQDTITGFCTVKAIKANNIGPFTGVVSNASTTQDGGTPTGATVSCAVWVNGIVSTPWYQFSGNPTQTGADQTQFDANVGDAIAVCKRVVYDDQLDSGFICTEVQITDTPGGPLLVGKT